jgi:uncharacterized protein (DUF849 family)
MARDVMITCAVTGGGDTVSKSPFVPITPEQIARSALEAASAGAAIVHIHVREPDTGKPSMRLELYRETVDRIRERNTDVLINLTTGAGGRYVPSAEEPGRGGEGTTMRSPEVRVQHIQELRPDICSLDVATMNFGEHVFMNTPAHLRRMAQLIAETGVKPELEVFDSGHLRLARRMIEDGLIGAPPMLQICLGIPWGAPATSETMLFLRDQLPAGAVWASFGISRQQRPMAAQAALFGGHVRVGLEDNLYIAPGELAPNNACLVEQAVKIVEALGDRPASPDAARQLLQISKRAH